MSEEEIDYYEEEPEYRSFTELETELFSTFDKIMRSCFDDEVQRYGRTHMDTLVREVDGIVTFLKMAISCMEYAEPKIRQARLSALQECREIVETSIFLNRSKEKDAEGFSATQFNLEELYSHKAFTGEAILKEIQSLIDKESNE